MKAEKIIRGDFNKIVNEVPETYIKKNRGCSIVESADYVIASSRIAIRTIERFSNMMSERISTTVTFIENGDEIIVNIISTGFEGLLFNRGPEGKAETIKKLETIIDELGD